MTDTPCPFCGQIHGTACPGPYEIHTSLNQPPWFGWVVTDHTTPSGQQLFRCTTCGIESPTPDKWEYHADVCYAELHRRLKEREAMCEWLAGRATMIEREIGKQPTWDSSDDWLNAAREAVREDS